MLCRIISVECPTNFDPRFMLIGCLGLPLFWLDVSSGKFKFVGHSTEIIQQSEIKGPLKHTSFEWKKLHDGGTYSYILCLLYSSIQFRNVPSRILFNTYSYILFSKISKAILKHTIKHCILDSCILIIYKDAEPSGK